MTRSDLILLSYLVAAACFLLGLRGLTSPKTARSGTWLAALGMLIAVIGTLLHHEIIDFTWIVIGLGVGTLIGIPMGLWIPMTKMPERIALSHSFGGLAVALIGVVEYSLHAAHMQQFKMGAIVFEVLFGAVTFTGSLMAFGKLQGILPGRPITFGFQNPITIGLFAILIGIGVYLVVSPETSVLFYSMFGLAFLLGVLLVLPIGGADMPVVICLLNSYAGLAAAASGFALHNNILIICGALDGGSGFILAILMSKAMNRSFANVLFGAVGKVDEKSLTSQTDSKGPVKSCTIEEAAMLFDSAQQVIIVPGYGMAVAQAQHAVRNLADVLAKKGVSVKYAIHPVAGRMPGHMNVLLAEANIPYDQLHDMDDINPNFPQTDVALVIGANDITNPSARTKKDSPLYGMPILEVDKAHVVLVCKRSMAPGFAGVDNELYYDPKTLMLFGDAKDTITKLSSALKS